MFAQALIVFVLVSKALSLSSPADNAAARDVSSQPIVDLNYARYQGSTDLTSNITTFLSIRYAAPPVGSLRFQAPQKPLQVKDVQNATSLPPQCYQGPTGASPTNPLLPLVKRSIETLSVSEDCLFLDVAVPNFASAKGLPVVVWIHGGGYVAGDAGQYPSADLTKDSNNHAITVLIQYRLGAFGFLAGPEVKAKGALNAGLLDQTFALEWVQKYISRFGGDPDKVTIWGESAGAGSVLQHVVANGGRTNPPLFRASITSSTFLPSQYPGDSLIPSAIYKEVVTATGCSNSSDTFKCLVALDAATLGGVNSAIADAGFFGTFTFVPVIDGKFIVERPSVTLRSGKVNGEMILTMTNSFEGRVFVETNVTNTTAYAKELFPFLDAAQTKAVAEKYAAYSETFPTADDQAIAIMGESIFVCPTYFLLDAFSGSSWKGEFAVPPGNHGNDVAYYFSSNGVAYNNTEFIASFNGSFLDFVVSLDPNAKLVDENITPKWAKWANEHAEMLFNVTAAGQPDIRAITTDPGLLKRCALWASLSAQTAQ